MSSIAVNSITPSTGSTVSIDSFVPAGQFSLRNKIINGAMLIDQRNAGVSQTITGGVSPLAYSLDRWQVRSAGANATVQQVAGTGNSRRIRFTGAASISAVALHQRIEAANCYDLAGRTVTLSFLASSTSLTSLTVEIYRANSIDSFGTWASPTVTLESTQSLAINTTEQTITLTFALSTNATTGLEIRIIGGALLGSQTLTIGNVQLEVGSVATPFEHRPIGTELALCRRYYETGYFHVSTYISSSVQAHNQTHPMHPKRAAPSVTVSNLSGLLNATSALAGSGSNFLFFQTTGATAAGVTRAFGDWQASAEL